MVILCDVLLFRRRISLEFRGTACHTINYPYDTFLKSFCNKKITLSFVISVTFL